MKPLFKCAIVAVCLLFAGSGAYAHVSGINVLSQSHEVWGGTYFNGVLDEYHIISQSPLEGRSIGSISKTGDFSVMADACGDDSSNIGGAYAASSYVFEIEAPFLSVNLNGRIWFTLPQTSVTYRLTDLTATGIIDEFSYSPSNAGPRDSRGNCFFDVDRSPLALDTSHIYEMFISAQASTGDGGTAILNADLSAQTIPAPSSLLLGAIGMFLTGWYRKAC